MTIKEKIIDIINDVLRPIDKEELANILGFRGKEARALYKTLKEMEKENLISKDEKGLYKVFSSENSFLGTVDMAERGFAFIIVPGRNDIFVSRDNLNTAMDGDEVIVTIIEAGGEDQKDEGFIEKIVKRSTSHVVGKLTHKKGDNFAFLIPDSKNMKNDIFISASKLNGAKDGQKVYAKITKYPVGNKNPEGEIVEVLGYPEDQGIDVLSIAYKHGIRMEFPEKVLRIATEMPVSISEEDCKGREDFRDKLIFTIDGADAKDLDDAISIEKLDSGNYLLGVHIADVSHYVKENSAIDNEARKRGNSVYLLDRVVPMLPRELSNGICSLNPDEDRLTMSVLMEFNKNGKLMNSKITESVIRSKARLVYDDVSNYLEDNDQVAAEKLGPEITESLDYMLELMKILNKKRHDKGAIDFNFAESKIELDAKGKVIDIRKEDRRVGNRIIEEFMLITNETVSEDYFWQEIPFLYRIHEMPDEEKLNTFVHFIRGLGYSIKLTQNEIHPRELQEIIEKIQGKKEEAVVSRMMLRSLKKARYSETNDIHFGLSSRYYSHFTSPIRRYPDLQIHRIIKENLKGKLSPTRIDHYDSILPDVADNSSKTERTAEDAERDVEKIKKAEYMERFVGEVYTGIISGITSFGIFVELENTVEGLVSYTTMTDDYYIYDEASLTAKGERHGKTYHLGDRVTIEVAFVDVEKSIIDFKFTDGVRKEES